MPFEFLISNRLFKISFVKNCKSLLSMYCIVSYVTKVNGSTLLKDCTTKNGQINAATMKDEASCNAKRKNIDVNMKAATTVENIKEPSHCATYANGKDKTVCDR